MAGVMGTSDSSVGEFLAREPQLFSFFQAVRLLTRYAGTRPRFRVHQSLVFPASDIQELMFPKEGYWLCTVPDCGNEARAVLLVNLMGLTGPAGELPVHYTAELIRRSWEAGRQRDFPGKSREPTAVLFDLFNDHLIGLLFEAWEYTGFLSRYERAQIEARAVPASSERIDPEIPILAGNGFENILFAMAGLTPEHVKSLSRILGQDTVVRLAVLLQFRPLSLSLAETALKECFELEVRCESMVGRWLPIPDNLRAKLGEIDELSALDPQGGGPLRLILGGHFWDRQSCVRIILGPLSFDDYRNCLPDGNEYHALLSVIELMLPVELDFQIVLEINPREIPKLYLDGSAGLGHYAWLGHNDVSAIPQHVGGGYRAMYSRNALD